MAFCLFQEQGELLYTSVIFLFKANELWLRRMERSGDAEVERGFILIGLAHFLSVLLAYIPLTS